MPPFREGMLHVLNNSCDRDTNGSVAGALLGAYWGERDIPENWKARVEKAGEIVALANCLKFFPPLAE